MEREMLNPASDENDVKTGEGNRMLVDSHAHLDMEPFEADRDEVIKRAFDSGVINILNVAVDLESARRSVELSGKYEGIYAAVGVHPHEARFFDDGTEKSLREMAGNDKVLAVGEIGLDYHYDNSPRELQKRAFVRQLKMASELGLPVVIHYREAEEDFMEIISENSPSSGGVVHCFSGDERMARGLLDMGYFLSFGGPVTFKKNKKFERLFKILPIERILIETDCPYLTPVPFRGRRNEPAYVAYVAERMAALMGLTVTDVARITGINFRSVFGLDLDMKPVIAYLIRNSLYLNITNRCSNACRFCARNTSYLVKGHYLRLSEEPEVEQILKAVDSFSSSFDEVVFCGFGEPTMRIEEIIAVSRVLRKRGLKVRINTNGHAELIVGGKVVERLRGLVDAVSISLNASDAGKYYDMCRPRFGKEAYQAVIDFARECRGVIPEITLTVVEMSGVDVEKCREIARELDVGFRVRQLNNVG